MVDRRLRLRALLDRQFTTVLVLLLVLALVGGWMTYTAHVAPGTETVERQASSWRTTGWFNHSTTVTENNSVYPVGTTLVDRPIYVATIAPRLDGTYAFTYDASQSGTLDGTVVLEYLLRGVQDRRDRTMVVWQRTRHLAMASSGDLAPGETIRVPFSVDMNETMNRTDRIDEQLGHPPGQPEAAVRARVSLSGTVNGREVEQVREHVLPVTLSGAAYSPDSPGRVTDRREATQTVAVERSAGPLRTIGGPATNVVSILFAAGLVAARRTGRLRLSEAERERIDHDDARSDFDEWISTIRLPDEALDLPRAEASSLGALVDFAIDTDNCVLEDPENDAYYVVHGGYLYTYRPPAGIDGGRLNDRAQTSDDDGSEPDVEGSGPTGGGRDVPGIRRDGRSDGDALP